MISTEREHQIAEAKTLGDDWAKHRAPDWLKAFLCETEIIDDLYEAYSPIPPNVKVEPARYLELLTTDYLEKFERLIANAYAMGHMDCADQIALGAYKHQTPRTGPQPSKLILPGE